MVKKKVQKSTNKFSLLSSVLVVWLNTPFPQFNMSCIINLLSLLLECIYKKQNVNRYGYFSNENKFTITELTKTLVKRLSNSLLSGIGILVRMLARKLCVLGNSTGMWSWCCGVDIGELYSDLPLWELPIFTSTDFDWGKKNFKQHITLTSSPFRI